jgi:hypothetical protein
MTRFAPLLAALLAFPALPVHADSSRALRDIAFTTMAVRRGRTAQARKVVLDRTFDAASLDLRDSVRDDGAVRGRNGSPARRNWFASGDWYTPAERPKFAMPELTPPARGPGIIGKMGSSFKFAIAPYVRLIEAASRGSWSSVSVVQTLAS